jgi:uncharacterized protein YkwD
MRRQVLTASLLAGSCSLLAFVPTGPAADNFDALRVAFLERINAARREAPRPMLRLSETLSRVAQSRAEAFVAGGEEPGSSTAEADGQVAAERGYESRFLTEVLIEADGDVEMVVSDAAAPGGGLHDEIARSSTRDLGVGVAVREEVPLYVFLFGLSWGDFIAGKREEFANLESVRRALLERVNRERRAAGVPPMRPEPLLDETAQRYARDMLARSFYGHDSPEGTTVLERSKAAGYRPASVAENIARGQNSVEEVMDGWMASTIHRENILSPIFAELGSGVAVGKNANGYQILWVQCFGRSKTTTPWRRQRSQPPGKS